MLLDVVMETDDAGLRLITYVREQLGNTDLQIIVRTIGLVFFDRHAY